MRYVSPPIPLPADASRPFDRADIVVEVDQAGPSYEARVFLENPGASAATPASAEHGYVGSFHVYGYSLDEGRGAAASATNPVQLPMRRKVTATDAVRSALRSKSHVQVTVVPVTAENREVAGGFRVKTVSLDLS